MTSPVLDAVVRARPVCKAIVDGSYSADRDGRMSHKSCYDGLRFSYIGPWEYYTSIEYTRSKPLAVSTQLLV